MKGCLSLTHPRAKLGSSDVKAIRVWAQTDGFGLPFADQVRALEAIYPTVKDQALYAVLRNESFFDPTYDRTVRLAIADEPSAVPAFWLWLVTWVWLLRQAPSTGLALPVFNPAFYQEVR